MHFLKQVRARQLGTAVAELLFITLRSAGGQQSLLLSYRVLQRRPVQTRDTVRSAFLPTGRLRVTITWLIHPALV